MNHLVSWYANPSSTNTMRGGKKWKNKTPNIRDGPFSGSQFSHAYYLWKLEFHWGQPGKSNKGSEHTVNGKAYVLKFDLHKNIIMLNDYTNTFLSSFYLSFI